jgi:hypothetical protein
MIIQYLNRNLLVFCCIVVVMISNYIVCYVYCVSLTLVCAVMIYTGARKK